MVLPPHQSVIDHVGNATLTITDSLFVVAANTLVRARTQGATAAPVIRLDRSTFVVLEAFLPSVVNVVSYEENSGPVFDAAPELHEVSSVDQKADTEIYVYASHTRNVRVFRDLDGQQRFVMFPSNEVSPVEPATVRNLRIACKLVDAANGDYHRAPLLSGEEVTFQNCVDVCRAPGLNTVDLDGDPRPDQSGFVDIGFDELRK